MIKNLLRFKIHHILLATLALGVFASLAIALLLLNHNQKAIRESLDIEARELSASLLTRINTYQYGLHATRGVILVAGEHNISRDTFSHYSMTLDIAKQFPGARGFGFIRLVHEDQVDKFLVNSSADGKEDFAITELAPHNGDRYVVECIEPFEPNAQAISLDIASEPNRREAAQAAMRDGAPRLTAPITLVQLSGEHQLGFLMLLPIYRTFTTPTLVADREAQTFGWSYVPLSIKEVLADMNFESYALDFELSDISNPSSPISFFKTNATPEDLDPSLVSYVEKEVFGRRWQFVLRPQPMLIERLHLLSPTGTLLAGLALSFLLAALINVIGVNRQRHKQILAEQARRASIVDSSADGIIAVGIDGVVTSWNQGATLIFGFTSMQTVGSRLIDLLVPDNLIDEEHHLIESIYRGERITGFETQRLNQFGCLLDVSITAAPILVSSDGMVGASMTVRDISVQKAAQLRIHELNSNLEVQVADRTRELRELNILLSCVLRSASEVSIIATDENCIIRVFNQGAIHLLGYPAEDVIGHTTPVLFHAREELVSRGVELSADTGRHIDGFRAVVFKAELEGADTHEWTYVRKDGSRFPVTLVVTPMRDEGKHIIGYLCIAVDITERKVAEKKLAASLETTRAILETAVNPMFTLSASGVVRSFNPAGERNFGYTKEAIVGEPVQTLIDAESWPALAELIARISQPGVTAAFSEREMTGRRKDGSFFPFQMSIGVMETTDGSRFVCVITDISLLQQQRRELTSARDQLLLAAHVAQLGIWSWNLSDNQLQWNEQMFELYGLSPTPNNQTLDFELWRSRIHPQDLERTTAGLAAAVEGGEPFDCTFRIVWLDGQVRYIKVNAQVERSADALPLRMIGINLDVTSERELQRRLFEAKNQANESSAAKSTFLANMSHEIRTPMNAVLGMLYLVQQTPLNDRQRDYINKAHSAATSLLGLLNDILDYSKIEAGKLVLDVHPFELETLLRDLAIVVSGSQGTKPVEVLFDLDCNLPSRLIGDQLRLQQVLINLAGNALKFTPQGEIVISVRQLQRASDSIQLQISISDTGIGINPQQLKNLFEGFMQAEVSTSRRFGGTGLGLVICKRLVALMGGELQVESTYGMGSRFWFDLVLGIAEVRPLKEYCLRRERPLRVLVVDDNDTAQALLMRTVQGLGWQADCSSDGYQAVERVREAMLQGRCYDVVLMDWRMPALDGLGAAQLIQKIEGDVAPPKVIMITAYGGEVLANASEIHTKPFESFLTKPVTPQQLADAVLEAIGELEPTKIIPNGNRQKRLSGWHLLVVEDNALNRQVADELLSGEGATVKLAEGGLDGVKMVLEATESFSAVLMDVQMPDIDGLEATRRIRSDTRFAKLPILAMTANASQADREICLAAGMNDHIGKPIDKEILITRLLAQKNAPDCTMPLSGLEILGTPKLAEGRDSILRRFSGNFELIERILKIFEPDINLQLAKLEDRLRLQDFKGAAAILHSIKGSAGTMGADALSARASALESQANQPDASFLFYGLTSSTVSELRQLLSHSLVELKEMLESPRPL